jgi:ferredoxin
MPKITVKVDPTLCITAANCVGIAPKIFQIGDEPYAELLDRKGVSQGPDYSFQATDEELALIDEAVESCPTRAISCERD